MNIPTTCACGLISGIPHHIVGDYFTVVGSTVIHSPNRCAEPEPYVEPPPPVEGPNEIFGVNDGEQVEVNDCGDVLEIGAMCNDVYGVPLARLDRRGAEKLRRLIDEWLGRKT